MPDWTGYSNIVCIWAFAALGAKGTRYGDGGREGARYWWEEQSTGPSP